MDGYVDPSKELLERKIDTLEERIFSHVVLCASAFNNGILSVNLKESVLARSFDELARLYFEYALSSTKKVARDYLNATLDLNFDFVPQRVTALSDLQVNLFLYDSKVVGSRWQQNARISIVSDYEMARMGNTLTILKALRLIDALGKGEEHGSHYFKFTDDQMELAAKSSQQARPYKALKIPLIGKSVSAIRGYLAQARGAIEEGIARHYFSDGIYDPDMLARMQNMAEFPIPKDTLSAVRDYLGLAQDEQRTFLDGLHAQIVEEQKGSYSDKLKARHVSTAMTLGYFADKMRGFGLTEQGDALERTVNGFVKTYRPELKPLFVQASGNEISF